MSLADVIHALIDRVFAGIDVGHLHQAVDAELGAQAASGGPTAADIPPASMPADAPPA